MHKTFSKYLFTLFLLLLVSVGASFSVSGTEPMASFIFPQDPDSLEQASLSPIFYPSLLDSLEESEQTIIPQPENFNYRAEYDPSTGMVILYRMVGNIPVRLPYTMSLAEYRHKELRQSMLNFLSKQRQELLNSEEEQNTGIRIAAGQAMENILGSDIINIRPQGIAELQVGINHTRIENPTLQEQMRNTTTFDFEEKIMIFL